MADTMDDEVPTKIVDVTGSGIDWDDLPDEEEEEDEDEAPPKRSLVPVFLLLSGLAAIVILLLLLNVLTRRQESQETGLVTTDGPDAELIELGEPYSYSVVGCGSGWSPGVSCEPFAGQAPRTSSIDLVMLEKQDAYLRATIQPIDVWLLLDGGRRQRLERRSEGDGVYVFSVLREEKGWDRVWGDGEELQARLVILPRGAELDIEDEWTWLRRTEELRLKGPLPGEDPDESASPGIRPEGTAASSGDWAWKSGESVHSASYDVRKKAFVNPLVLVGGTSNEGVWRFTYRTEKRGAAVADLTVEDPPLTRGSVDVGRPLTRLMRDAAVIESLGSVASGEETTVYAGVRVPGGESELAVAINLVGEVIDTGVEHKICVMMRAIEGLDLPEGKVALTGHARIGATATMRPTFDVTANSGAGECADGGKTGRWKPATFGPGKALLEFVYEGSEESLQTARGKTQRHKLPVSWSEGPAKCLAITVFLGPNGWQGQAPSVKPLYDLVDGRCQ